jgi:hypothetical protein
MATASDIGQCLQNTLSSDPNTRISAELKLGELLALPGAPIAQSDRGDPFSLRELLLTRFTDAGLVLSHIGLAQDADMSLRQMSNRVLSELGQHHAQKVRDGALVAIFSGFQRRRTSR